MAEEKKVNLTLRNLFDNSTKVLGYPHKQDRNIKIKKSSGLVGVKSLRIDAEAHGTSLYPVSLIFYDVSYSDKRDEKHVVPINMKDRQVWSQKVNVSTHPVRAWCACKWFQFACEWYLHDAGSLAPGHKRRPYTPVPGSNRPSPNPKQLPCVCKHVYQLALELQRRGLLTNV